VLNIINLLLNAIQATQVHGLVHLHIYREHNELLITITNNGSHIPPEQIAYLFEPFTSLSESGSGLGLWVVYQIAHQLGGRITVHSDPDDTRFCVQLPLQENYE
jgi:signal transduction histidine kinase